MDEQDRQNLLVFIVAVLLVAVSLWLIHSTQKTIKLEDCAFSGRRNCNPIPIPADR
jgi:hypothetical protein